MNFSTIQFYAGPRLSTIVLDRPPLNVINLQMLEELNAAWSEVEDISAQVVVISGAGDRAFSAGVDVNDHAPGRIQAALGLFHDLVRRIRESNSISIAAIHGYTLGGGAELAMICDLVIAADDASIGQPEIALGCYPPVAVAWLPSAIGFHRAAEMVLLGRPIGAVEAERFGIINKVVPPDQLSESVDACADALLGKSSAVLALAKQALRGAADCDFNEALDRAHRLYIESLIRTEDMSEGMRAFLEKRPPQWKNR